jgi:hypothetical protein
METMDGALKKRIISSVLVVAAIALLIPIYNAPVWWVSLEAPNYPEESFPDGVKILFHFNGVFSGCEFPDSEETGDSEALDCTHEMDTINHYVGMYPIAAGGPLELFFSVFLVALVGVLLLAYLVKRPLVRTLVMAAGFASLAVWMAMAYYGEGGLRLHSSRYLEGVVTSVGEDASGDPEAGMTAGEAMIARLKASLAESADTESDDEVTEGKARSIETLRNAFEQDRHRQGTSDQAWKGNGTQLIAWHYERSLGRYFREQDVLAPMVNRMIQGGSIFFGAIILVMVLLLVLARKPKGLVNDLLLLVPAGLPLFFVIEYSAWLWWYGHNMNEMGAFTLKSFMPTVFGQGKVAQFTTNSYPAYGFWLMVLFSALLVAALLVQRAQEPAGDGD